MWTFLNLKSQLAFFIIHPHSKHFQENWPTLTRLTRRTWHISAGPCAVRALRVHAGSRKRVPGTTGAVMERHAKKTHGFANSWTSWISWIRWTSSILSQISEIWGMSPFKILPK